MAQRRHKKLEEINLALEQLKHENVATDALKPKSSLSPHPTSYPPMRSGKDLMFIGILLVCVVVLVVFSFYYRSQYSKLNDNYQEKVDKLASLEAALQKKVDALETTQEERDKLEASEKDFLRDRDKLEAEIEDLQNEINTLEADITTKRNELDNLTRTVSDQRREIDRWKDCIEDELNENLSVCD